MRRAIPNPRQTLDLVERVDPKFCPVWDGCAPHEQVALARYFLPHGSRKSVLGPTRPRVVKWYCPFATQCDFPSGHRYCINVYTGCSHGCDYCYAAGYGPEKAGNKKDFEKLIDKDMEDLERFDVPPAPVHLSNSTDPFQPLEKKFGHTKYALERILAHRNRFTSVVVLTKNPLLAAESEYVDLFQRLVELPPNHPKRQEFDRRGAPGFVIEVSLAFWQESARGAYDRCAPTIEKRIEGIKALKQAGIPIVLRIDPLFPRSPLSEPRSRTLADFGLPEAQTIDDLENLVAFAKEMGVRHVVYSTAKIVQPRGRKLSETMQAMRKVYEALSVSGKPPFRGGSWRLSPDVANAQVVGPFLEICKRVGLKAKYCKGNLIETA